MKLIIDVALLAILPLPIAIQQQTSIDLTSERIFWMWPKEDEKRSTEED